MHVCLYAYARARTMRADQGRSTLRVAKQGSQELPQHPNHGTGNHCRNATSTRGKRVAGRWGGERGGHLCARARFDLGFDLGLISVLTSVLRTPLANRIASQHDRAPSRGARNSRPGHLGFCCLHLGFFEFWRTSAKKPSRFYFLISVF